MATECDDREAARNPSRLHQLFDDLLQKVANGKHRKMDVRLTPFSGVKGSKYTGQLMVVGRAVNGWKSCFTPQQALDRGKRVEIIQETCSGTANDSTCPMAWVTNDWGATGYKCTVCGHLFNDKVNHCTQCNQEAVEERYDTKASAFWRTVKLLVETRGIADVSKPDWPSHLVWTDLYKVSPEKGGNPSSTLCTIQFEACKELFLYEIESWRPRCIVFFTGNDWAEPFLKALHLTDGIPSNGRIERAQRMSVPPDKMPASLVVGPHPQWKRKGETEEQLVSEISGAFARLEDIGSGQQ